MHIRTESATRDEVLENAVYERLAAIIDNAAVIRMGLNKRYNIRITCSFGPWKIVPIC